MRAFVRSWADAAIDSGADRVFWDEPHWVHPEHFGLDPARWGCRCRHCQARWAERRRAPVPGRAHPELLAFRQACLVDFVADLVAHCHAQGGATTVCLLPLVGASTACPTGRPWPPCPAWGTPGHRPLLEGVRRAR